MPRQHIRPKRLKMTPEISCNLPCEQRASNGVYFRVIETLVNKYLLCISVPTLDKLKIWQTQILSRILEGWNKFCQSSASGPYLSWGTVYTDAVPFVSASVSIRLHLSFTRRRFEFVIKTGSFWKRFQKGSVFKTIRFHWSCKRWNRIDLKIGAVKAHVTTAEKLKIWK